MGNSHDSQFRECFDQFRKALMKAGWKGNDSEFNEIIDHIKNQLRQNGHAGDHELLEKVVRHLTMVFSNASASTLFGIMSGGAMPVCVDLRFRNGKEEEQGGPSARQRRQVEEIQPPARHGVRLEFKNDCKVSFIDKLVHDVFGLSEDDASIHIYNIVNEGYTVVGNYLRSIADSKALKVREACKEAGIYVMATTAVIVPSEKDKGSKQ